MSEQLKVLNQVNEAVAKAGNIKQPSKKQLEKAAKQEKDYWNGMITRQEAKDLVVGLLAQEQEKLRMMYISVTTTLEALKQKGIVTDDELAEISKPIIEALYGPATTGEKEKEEATPQSTEVEEQGQ